MPNRISYRGAAQAHESSCRQTQSPLPASGGWEFNEQGNDSFLAPHGGILEEDLSQDLNECLREGRVHTADVRVAGTHSECARTD